MNTESKELARTFTLSMKPSLMEELRKVAESNDLSLSHQARIALREWLEAYAKERAT